MAELLDYALTTVADVKESLDIASSDNSKNNLITRKINLATLVIESWCNLPMDHHFKRATYTNEAFDGNGSNQLILRMRPVVSISSFQYRDSSGSDSSFSDVESDIYFSDLSAGIIESNINNYWGWNRYRVTYVAGYETIPADLAEAAVALASYYVENSASGTAVKKKQEGQRSIEYFDNQGGGDGSVIDQLGLDDVLNRYKRYSIADSV